MLVFQLFQQAVNMVLGGKMVWACPSLSLGSCYSGVPSAFGRPLRAPSIPHAGAPHQSKFWKRHTCGANWVRLQKTVFYCLTRLYSIEDVSGKIVMCLNEQQRKDLSESRYDEIHNTRKLLQQGKTIKQGLERYLLRPRPTISHIR